MKNLLDISCPQCGNTDDLHVETDDGGVVYLGPWWVPEDEERVAALKDQLRPESLIWCQVCERQAPFVDFDGDLPAGIRRTLRILARFREAITLDYRLE